MSLRQKGKRRWLCALLAAAALFCAAAAGVKAEGHEPCRRHDNSQKMIALTFDDGPHPRYTEEILDILKEYGVRATFFVVGSNVEANLDLVKREIAEGHEIGNHTYSHPHLTSIGSEELIREMEMTESILREMTGCCPRLFRPPEGVYSQTVSGAIKQTPYIPILWTVDTEDWRRPSAEAIARIAIENTKTGVIILCHDYVSGKSNTPAALRIFLPKLIEQGYRFVTVSELLESS